MERRYEGHLALDYIIARASSMLIGTWDGCTERVAWIVQEGGDEHPVVGFMARSAAIQRLHALAASTERPDLAAQLRDHAAELSQGATGNLQCIVYGWDGVMLVSFAPRDLHPAPGAAAIRDFADFADLIETATTPQGAATLLAEARAGLSEPVAELDRLADLVLEGWQDIGAVAVATAKATLAIDSRLATAGGQRAREIVNALAQATSDRGSQGRSQNAKGGSA